MNVTRAVSSLSPLVRRSAAIAVTLVLAACATPSSDPALVNARDAVDQMARDPLVSRYAAVEATRAQDALRRAEAAVLSDRGRDEVAHRAYVAQQLAATAIAHADARNAEQRVQQANAAREQIILEARTREATVAQSQAQQAQQEAQQAQMQAQQAQQQVATAQSAAAEQEKRAEELKRQLQEFNAKQTDRGSIVTLGSDVLFDVNKAELRPGARRAVQRLADVLEQHPDRKVTVEGFTDSTGSAEYNLELSRRRAEAVRDALAREGVPAENIEVQPHGQDYPVADNSTPTGRQMNRRVEIIISDDQAASVAR
jgi:outer membrane protein OmpA-like peptidoglycan-associated protein